MRPLGEYGEITPAQAVEIRLVARVCCMKRINRERCMRKVRVRYKQGRPILHCLTCGRRDFEDTEMHR